MSGSHLSKGFFDFVKQIGESKSKQEEDRIIVNEVRLLKAQFQQKSLTKKQIKENLVRLIYVEMLGHDASFAYVHAIQLTASGDLMQKKVGYLCAALTLSPEHEFRFMLVNQLQRDLSSPNLLEVSTALIALSKLITEEMIPALLPSVAKLLNHEQSVVRKKSALALHRIYQLDAGSIDHIVDSFRRVLCDKDPSVMGASLCLLHDLARANVQSQKDLVSSYVSILKQIIEHRLPKDFDYHRIPAPWIQIKLLKILACLGENDQRASEGMYEVLNECMKRANTGIYVGYAIIYECVQTVTTIYPNPVLLDAAAGAIAKFIQSDSHNLKYLGVTGLAAIVRDHPRYAAEHQMIVLDCLEDPDETLKRKTLDLLFRMTNPVNAEVVVEKLVYFLKDAVDKFLRQDLVTRICQLAERFAPNNIWYVRTVTKVFELGGDLVEFEVAHNLLRLLAEGVGDDCGEDEDVEMRREACEIFYDLFEKPILPDILLRVMFWTLGEYAYLMGSEVVPEVLEVICEAAGRQGMSSDTRGYGVSAVMKMSAQLGRLPPEAADLVDKYSTSLDVDLQQKCYEFREIARDLGTLTAVLPVDASCEDLTVPDFSFLDSFVEAAKANGAPDYSPPSQKENDMYEYDEAGEARPGASQEPTLKYDAYEKPAMPSQYVVTTSEPKLDYSNNSAANTTTASGGSQLNGQATQNQSVSGLNLQGVKSVWGASGYALQQKQAANPTTALGNNFEAPSAAPPPQAPPATTDEYTIPREPTPPPQVETKPKELSERERMAAALFGGVTAPSSGARPKTPPSLKAGGARRRSGANKPVVNTTAASSSSPPPAQEQSPVNLLDFGDDFGGNPSPINQSLDLLAALDSEPAAPAPPPASVPASAPAPAADLTDLLGGFSSEPAADVLSTSPPPFTAISITTQEFGQKWVSFAAEAKFTISLQGVSSIQDIVGKIQNGIGLGLVEVIQATEEAIFAGTDPQTASVVLFHAKRQIPVGASIIVRSTNPELSSRAQHHSLNLLS